MKDTTHSIINVPNDKIHFYHARHTHGLTHGHGLYSHLINNLAIIFGQFKLHSAQVFF